MATPAGRDFSRREPTTLRWWRVWDPLDYAFALTWRFRRWSIDEEDERERSLADNDFRSMVISALTALTGVYILAGGAVAALVAHVLNEERSGLVVATFAAVPMSLPLGVMVAWYFGFKGLRREAARVGSNVASLVVTDPRSLTSTRNRGLVLSVAFVFALPLFAAIIG